MVQNKGLIFEKVPTGWPKAGEHLTIKDRPINLGSTPPPENGLLTENFYVSFDPYQRGRMRSAEVKSYAPPYELGKPISNGAVSKVLKSGNSKFKEGDIIFINGACPTEEYSLLPAGIVESSDLNTHAWPAGQPGRPGRPTPSAGLVGLCGVHLYLL